MNKISLELNEVGGEVHCSYEKESWSAETGWGSSEYKDCIIKDASQLDHLLDKIMDWAKWYVEADVREEVQWLKDQEDDYR